MAGRKDDELDPQKKAEIISQNRQLLVQIKETNDSFRLAQIETLRLQGS